MLMQVDTEQYSGSFYQKMLSSLLTNAYMEIDAVILRLVPVGLEDVPGVLIGAHFDSTLGSPGTQLPLAHICKQLGKLGRPELLQLWPQ